MSAILNRAISLFKNGKRGKAAELLKGLIEMEPRNETAWLWLSACVESIADKQDCLLKVLEINPVNQTARKALKRLIPIADSSGLEQPSLEDVLRNLPSKQGGMPTLPRVNKNWRNMIIGVLSLLIVAISVVVILTVTEGRNSHHVLPITATSTIKIIQTSIIARTPTCTTTPTSTGTMTTTPTVTQTATTTPTQTPTPYLIQLTLEVKTNEGWYFTIEKIEVLAEIMGEKPEKDWLLVILMRAKNNTGKFDRLLMSQFKIITATDTLSMDYKYLNSAKIKYQRDYPGAYMGQIIGTSQEEESVLVFDVLDDRDKLELYLVDKIIELGKISVLRNLPD